jgi:hypothetical protein
MLFDLRSPGRRRAIKTVYLFLALLIGLGLIGFGVGTGGNFGGLFSAAANGGGGSGTGNVTIERALTKAERKANASPSAATWLAVGEAAYAVATLPSNYDSSVGFTAPGHKALDKLKIAWNNYLNLLPKQPNETFAQEVVSAFSPAPTGVGDYPTAETAQEIVVQLHPNSYVQYEYLAYYAYYAKDINNGDLAAARALALAPKGQKKSVQSSLTSLRTSLVGATGASGATGVTASTGATG